VINSVFIRYVIFVVVLTIDPASAQKMQKDGTIDIQKQIVSSLSAEAIFSVKNHLHNKGIYHKEYDFFVTAEDKNIVVEANYRTIKYTNRWNANIRGCASRGRHPCLTFILDKENFSVLREVPTP
jgi:hypothetical protein